MPRPGSLGKSLLRMAFGPGRLSEYYYYYYYIAHDSTPPSKPPQTNPHRVILPTERRGDFQQGLGR